MIQKSQMNKLCAFIMSLIIATSVRADILDPPFWRTSSMFTGVIKSCIRRIIEPLQFYSYLDIWTCLIIVLLVLFIWKRKSKSFGKFLKWLLILVAFVPVVLAIFVDANEYLGYPVNILWYKIEQMQCPQDKPLFDGKNCFSCDEPRNLYSENYKYDFLNCGACPNREYRYNECGGYHGGPVMCALKNSPGAKYHYQKCKGWITTHEQMEDMEYE